jgi:hypothetical protein
MQLIGLQLLLLGPHSVFNSVIQSDATRPDVNKRRQYRLLLGEMTSKKE